MRARKTPPRPVLTPSDWAKRIMEAVEGHTTKDIEELPDA